MIVSVLVVSGSGQVSLRREVWYKMEIIGEGIKSFWLDHNDGEPVECSVGSCLTIWIATTRFNVCRISPSISGSPLQCFLRITPLNNRCVPATKFEWL